ncbi:MAG: hypothetical protein J6O18_04945 [Bacilli bacterium]|nr:hypothetical protein [Bacilli bacterium]
MNLYLGHRADAQNEISIPIKEAGSLLIAGLSGSGKSVYLHTMLKKALSHYGPESLKLVIYDGKRVEFPRYKDDPHLLLPIGTKIEDFQHQVTYLQGFIGNKEKSPVLFIADEFADIVYQNPHAQEEVERLMEVSLANGIYLILSTQIESSYSDKMLSLADTKMSFTQFEEDGLRFVDDRNTEALEQGAAIVTRKDKEPIRVKIEY